MMASAASRMRVRASAAATRAEDILGSYTGWTVCQPSSRYSPVWRLARLASDLPQLLQAPHPFRRRRLAAVVPGPGGMRDLGHVDVAVLVHRQPVRRHELPRRFAQLAEAAEQLALHVQHADARAEIGRLDVHVEPRPQLPHIAAGALALAEEQRAGPVQVVPLPLVLAAAIEDLHPVALAVRHIDQAGIVADDVVRQVEL